MDKQNLSLNSSSISKNDKSNIRSKLRRLRIQEALLMNSIQKPDRNPNEDFEAYETNTTSSSNYREFSKKLKDSYINVKNLYDEVKTNTQSQELLAELDIDEVKKKIFELESNIKIIKLDIASELADLKITEQDINKQINENPSEIENIKRQPKTHSVNYNTIVPSPVRVMMTSPFKCSEVQQFQEFMQNSPNRYGGWNEYNHNLFVKYWQKFFGKSYNSQLEDETSQQSITYAMFIEDVMTKLQGVTASGITSHVEWYIKYLFFKEKQQNAIDKWKWNKVSTGKVTKHANVQHTDEKDSFLLNNTMDDHNFIACNFNTSQDGQTGSGSKLYNSKIQMVKRKLDKPPRTHRIMKPTKQWLNRLNDSDVVSSSDYNCIENTKKLRIPHWRQDL